jgi:imidazole glycerol-phosphate synthase subunit HisH|tara:strand:+ start:566 stop:1195 length:630 start_codon:yes stop_codon:yes gene_type:complete
VIKKTVGILDFKTNNIASVFNCLSKIENLNIKIINNINDLKNLNHLIIPGVGSFGAGIDNLNSKNFLEEILFFSKIKNNFTLGICLGAQLLFERSEEDLKMSYGLGIFKGECKAIVSDDENIKIPHMGWNKVNIIKDVKILANIKNNFYAYFVHQYYISPSTKKCILGETLHEVNFPSIIGDENNFGTQFHPEKSGQAGFQFLKNFVYL